MKLEISVKKKKKKIKIYFEKSNRGERGHFTFWKPAILQYSLTKMAYTYEYIITCIVLDVHNIIDS